MSETFTLKRRELLRLTGAGIALGTVGVGAARGAREEYIVGTASRAATRDVRGRADAVSRVFDFGGIGQAVVGRFSAEALRGIARRPGVRYVEPNGRMYAIGGPTDVDSGDAEVPWGVDRVDAEKTFDLSDTGGEGAGAHVAIIDTGIDSDHPDLAANVGDGKAFVAAKGKNVYDWEDDEGHGTHCAGTAAAVYDGTGTGVVGVAPGATLHAVKVLDNRGSGSYADVIDGIMYVGDQCAAGNWPNAVASLSLGGPKSGSVGDACTYAYERGVLVVAAAGNDGDDAANYSPAGNANVVTVGATDDQDGFPSWTNYGDVLELSAPGVGIRSTVPGGGYDTYSGTSMACPHVSGGAAYLMAAGYSPADATAVLTAEAEVPSGWNVDLRGEGILDVEAVVAAIGGSGGGASLAVSTDAPTDVTAASATLHGSLGDLGGATSATVGFDYRQTGTESWTAVLAAESPLEAAGSFSAAIDGLVDGESYDYRATASGDDGSTATGAAATLTTTDDPAAVTTGSASNVGDTTATFGGTVDDLGGAASADAGFEYRTASSTGWNPTATTSVSADGADYTVDVPGLTAGTEYVFRAVATATDGDAATGAEATFATTGTAPSGAAPTAEVTATEAGSPNPHAEVTVDWTAGDADGDLVEVVVAVTAGTGGPSDSRTYTYDGVGSAGGSDYFEFKRVGTQAFDVTVTATDATGLVGTATDSVSS